MKSQNLIRVALLVATTIASANLSFAQSWNVTGNAGTDPANHFIGTTDNKALKIRTNNTARITVTSNGKVGIGTGSPDFKLDVKGSMNTDSLYRIGGTTALTTQGFGNTFTGWTYNTANTGTQNTFNGTYAGQNNAGGYNNSFFGYAAGAYNTTGVDNTSIGQVAGSGGTSGSYNTNVGKAAGYFNTTGSNNTFIGYAAGYSNGSSSNSFVGYRSGQLNTTGKANTYLGGKAGYLNSTGSYNVAIGDSALHSNTTGGNTAVGSKAGFSNTTGWNNSFFGNLAGSNHVSGGYNTYLGKEAGLYDSTGSENTCIGAEAGYSIKNGINNTLVGSFSGYIASGNNNSLFGKGSGAYLTTGSNNTFLGFQSGGNGAQTLSNATAIGANAAVTASNSMVLGSGVKVGIGITAPEVKFHVVGGTDASLASGGFIQTGATGSANVIIDDNEIMARVNGAASALHLNYNGGNVSFNGSNAASGNVTIGTTTPAAGYLLSVNGKVICEELKVALHGNWPDYVFGKEHKLMPLAELEQQIAKDKHLPGIPSASEMETNGGIHVGEMQTKMMEKIEELTLYVIQLKKDNDALQTKVNAITQK